MKRLTNRISYSFVLMTMILFMSTRFIPHHHCDAANHPVSGIVHFGYDDCTDCEESCHNHKDNCSHSHSHSQQMCCNYSHLFLRIFNENNPTTVDLSDIQPAISFHEEYLLIIPQDKEAWYNYNIKPPITKTASSHALRAPPVV